MSQENPSPERLTIKQDQVLLFFREYFKKNRRPPTLNDISKHFGWRSRNSAVSHVHALVAKGLLIKDKGVARGLRLAEEG